MDTGVLGTVALAGVGGYALYRAARSQRVRRVVVAGVRGGEKSLVFSSSTALRVGALAAAGAGSVAARSGGGLLQAAKLVDRLAV